MAPIRNGPDGSAEGSTARFASTVSARIFDAYTRNVCPAGLILSPRPSRRNSATPNSASSALIRAVMFDGTQCKSSAARAMLPTSATVLNMRICASSIHHQK